MTFSAQVKIPYFTGLPEDVIVNVLHFEGQEGGGTDFALLNGAIKAFYDTAYAGTTIGLSWAPWVNKTAAQVKYYNLVDAPPRAPVATLPLVLAGVTVSTSTIPPEMAVCLSVQGARISGVPQARRRGRVFLGGIGGTISGGSASAFPIFSDTILDKIGAAATGLVIGADTAGFDWVVLSRTTGLSTIITDGWIDNAFDTQRRRGNAPTARRTWT